MKKIIILLCLTLISNLCYATTLQESREKISNEVRIKFNFDEINEWQKDYIKNSDKLINRANLIIKEYPNDKFITIVAFNILGKTYESNNKMIEARKYYEKAYKLDSTSSRINYDFGIFEFKSKNYDKSLSYLSNVIKIENDNGMLSIAEGYIGDCYYNQKNYTEAIKHYTNGINYKPRKNLYNSRGRSFAEMKDFSTAIKDYNQSIIMDSNFTDAYHNRASAYYNLKNYDSAISDYKKTLELDPERKNIYYWIGASYHNLHNYSLAVDYYTKYLYYYPKDKVAYLDRGNCCLQIGDYATAVENFTQAILIDPNYVAAYKSRGITYRKMGSEEQARQDLQKAKNLGA